MCVLCALSTAGPLLLCYLCFNEGQNPALLQCPEPTSRIHDLVHCWRRNRPLSSNAVDTTTGQVLGDEEVGVSHRKSLAKLTIMQLTSYAGPSSCENCVFVNQQTFAASQSENSFVFDKLVSLSQEQIFKNLHLSLTWS